MPTLISEKKGEDSGVAPALGSDPGEAPAVRRKCTGAPRGAVHGEGSLRKRSPGEDALEPGGECAPASTLCEVEHRPT